MTKGWIVVMALLVLGVLVAPAPAEGDANSPAPAQTVKADDSAWAQAVKTIGACLGAALAAAAGSYGVSRIGSGCIEAIARQPEAARDMFAPMVVAAGMVEVGMLFAIVVCLMSLFQT